ncbi:MAG TPA: AAA family ATPase [Planctomycetaceae bacterium]|nr:AAA family ATPase [Planctomycetaceae bacterium]
MSKDDIAGRLRINGNGHKPRRQRLPTPQEIATWTPEGGIPDAPTPKPELSIVTMAKVQAAAVEWLWKAWIARGKVHLMCGMPGVGKSFTTCDLAARLTRGWTWPDGSGPAEIGDVLFLVGEDGLADVIRPRLDEAGADCERVHVLQSRIFRDSDGKATEGQVCLSRDVDLIDAALADRPAIRIVFIDPVSEYMGGVDSHKNAEVRSLLAPLSRMAERRGVAIVNVTHFNKAGFGPAMYRAMGSIGFTAQARVAWAFVQDQDDSERVLMLPLKNNLHRRVPGLAYRIAEGNGAGRVEWETEGVDITADEAMAPPSASKGTSKLDEAVQWLKTRLASGCVTSNQLTTEAGDAGIASKTLWRAKDKLKVRASKSQSVKGEWYWALSDAPNTPNSPNTTNDYLGWDDHLQGEDSQASQGSHGQEGLF